MVKLVFCCTRSPELSKEEFARYWLERHGPLVRSLRTSLPGMQRYVQSHTIETPVNDLIRESRGSAEAYDGITEVWFDNIESVGGSGADAVAAAIQLLEDERTFLDLEKCSVFMTEEHQIF